MLMYMWGSPTKAWWGRLFGGEAFLGVQCRADGGYTLGRRVAAIGCMARG